MANKIKPRYAESATPPSPGFIDDTSYRMGEIMRLEAAIPVQTELGKAVLHRLLTNGLTDRDQILARQEALEEVGSDEELRSTLSGSLAAFSEDEEKLLLFESQDSSSYYRYMGVTSASKEMLELCDATIGGSQEAPESAFLRQNLTAISEFNDTDLGSMLRGTVYNTAQGIKSKKALNRRQPFLRFRPALSGRLLAAGAASIIPVELGVLPSDVLVLEAMLGTLCTAMLLAPLGIQGRSMKDQTFNEPLVYNPLRDKLRRSPEFTAAMGAIGNLDTVVAQDGLRKKIEINGHPTTIPAIETGDAFHFSIIGMRNPLLALREDKVVVPNDLEFGGPDNRLTFLTGPNSGGKSTLAKAVIQNEILAQVGGACAAETASMTPADRIAYHVPMPPDLDDETGRLGFELGRVRGILNRSTERSLTLLDDCLDGTTHEERVQILKSVMMGFRYLGGATLFSTHAHELVGEFEENGEGQFIQVEFAGDGPTHRLIPGVSHTSHAGNVAKNYGFTEPQVRQEIESKGIVARWF